MHIIFLILLSFLISQQSVGLPIGLSNDQIITHNYYTLSYNENHEQANWVAYKLTNDMIKGTAKRKDKFKADIKVKNKSAQLYDYKNSGFDRGHLCPAADMKFSQGAMDETFYMSNMSPQVPSFNRGVWKSLESIVRSWTEENKEIYIVTGPILNNTIGSIGLNSISIPQYFYKVILDNKEPELKGIGFIIENKKADLELQSYAVPIDKVEELTGLDFFNLIPDKIENIVEAEVDIQQWNWKQYKSSSHNYKSSKIDTSEDNRLSKSSRCLANTKSGNRCKRKTYCSDYKCKSHKGNCY